MSARSWWQRGQAAVRILLAGLFGVQALVLLARGSGMFLRLGYPESARVALGVAEVAAAILTIIPKTFLVGTTGLIAVLAWAAGFHFGLHRRSDSLYADMALVALLMVAWAWSNQRKETAA